MASRRIKLLSVAAIAAMGAGGWFLYNALAAQGQGALAQKPLNNQVSVPPAFIMAVDDSGSMTYQVLLRGLDGGACWSGGSFFDGTNLNTCTSTGNNYWYIMPHAGYTASRSGRGLPPLDSFGFARSHEINPSYFNPYPEVTYGPWLESDGSAYSSADTDANGNAVVTATRADPMSNAVRFDLTNFLVRGGNESGASSYRFELRNGMRLPVGIQYYTTANCGGLGTTSGTRNTWVSVGSQITVSNTCTVGLRYFPATFYLRTDSPAPVGYLTAVVSPDANNRAIGGRVLATNSCGTGCDMYRYEIRPENYATPEAYQAAIQKYANWFSYYGNRNRAMIAGMTQSLATVNSMRVGYFTLKNRPATVPIYDMQVAGDREDLYADMFGLPASGGTPNLAAVDHIGQQFVGNQNAIAYACQKNAGMLFTDGFSNEGTPGAPAITGLGEPFDPTPSGSMAAIATRYYLNTNNTVGSGGVSPLNSTLTSGLVPIPAACSSYPVGSVEWKRLDCQSNLHMNFYGITLGARGARFNPDIDQDPYVDYSGWTTPKWPSHTNDAATTVDDIWHATVNTRGEFINAKTPADITAAMRRVLQSVAAGTSPSGTLALTGSRISTRSLTVQPSYEIRNEGTDWFSELEAFRLEMDPVTRDITETSLWEASDRLAATSASTRAAHTWYGHATGASRFNDSNITSFDMLCNNSRPGMSLCSSALIGSRLGISVSEAVDYLLGETSGEVRAGGALRNRTTLLGDIINSPPVVSAPTDDYGYRTLPSPYGTSYNTYMTTKESRPAMVYVGANDGMLHAFHGGINHEGTVDAANGGREQFAFIPRTVLGHMGNLLFPYVAADGGDQKFDHRYFVDGPVTVSDAYWSGSWKTVLVGTPGAGGRGVFGLDVSSPTSFGATDYLWEIDDQHSTAAVRNNIGHVLGKPVIVPVKSGATVAWKAIFGNGYNSESGRAVLFVVDMATGAVQMTQAVEPGAPTAGTNGLGNIVVVDRWGGTDMTLNTRDGYADTVYGADQKGAIWKFDLRTIAASIDTPLFTTREHTESGMTYRQPILGGLTATAGQGGGVMILFGTGSFSFMNDASDTSIQSIYGVLDTGAAGTLGRSNLLQRTILVSTDETRTISSGGSLLGYSGWFIDMPAGERAVGYPRVASGVLFIPTYAPTVADGCSTQGMNWLYGLNTRTGTSALEGVRFGSTAGSTQGAGVGALALDTAGTAPVKDVGLTVLSRSTPPNPDEVGAPDDGCWIRITVPGMTQAMFVPYPCGRQSWRQIE